MVPFVLVGSVPAFQVTVAGPTFGVVKFGALNDSRAVYGAQAGLSLTKNLSVVGNVGYSKTRPVLKNYAASSQTSLAPA